MIEKKVKIINKSGLHARPVTQFVTKARAFKSDVYLSKDDRQVKGDSIISIMSLGISYNDTITVSAEGGNASEAVDVLANFLATFVE